MTLAILYFALLPVAFWWCCCGGSGNCTFTKLDSDPFFGFGCTGTECETAYEGVSFILDLCPLAFTGPCAWCGFPPPITCNGIGWAPYIELFRRCTTDRKQKDMLVQFGTGPAIGDHNLAGPISYATASITSAIVADVECNALASGTFSLGAGHQAESGFCVMTGSEFTVEGIP